MTDRELLEAAAKAVGLSSTGEVYALGLKLLDGPHNYWNPLASNSDAFQLAVASGQFPSFPLRRSCDPRVVHCGRYWDSRDSMWYPYEEPLGSDPGAAARRVLVRAVAGDFVE